MKSTQYTVRSVPEQVDRALRRKAAVQGKSLNAVILESLEQGLGLQSEAVVHTDLDFLIGSWTEDKAFDRAIEDFERVDEDLWK